MFQGMKNLRSEGEEIEFTKEMIDEYIKCKEDIIYFAEKYVYITTLDKGNVKITLWDYQKKILKAFIEPPENKRHIILMQPRQSGKCFCDDTMIKVRNKKTGKIEEIEAKKFFDRIKSTK
ncbi:MAG: hypothetical protein ACOCZ5_00145 [bacterium]